MKCYCQSGKDFANCCEPYLNGEDLPDTAEKLMRSRYSAFATANIEYLSLSHEPEGREELDVKELTAWAKKSDWTGLEVVKTLQGEKGDSKGYVEFIARYRIGEQDYEHHEVAEFRFDKHEREWFYVDGKMVAKEPFVREEQKVGRNDPCPCGSGKKYKKCCQITAQI